eukprot:1883177-Prymnesium_polylepis.1
MLRPCGAVRWVRAYGYTRAQRALAPRELPGDTEGPSTPWLVGRTGCVAGADCFDRRMQHGTRVHVDAFCVRCVGLMLVELAR